MASSSQIIHEPYVAGTRGSLNAGIAITCRSAENGLCRAQRALENGSILGAQIVRMTHDASELGEPGYIETVST